LRHHQRQDAAGPKQFEADFDEKGKLLGVEILDASKILNKKVILEAQEI